MDSDKDKQSEKKVKKKPVKRIVLLIMVASLCGLIFVRYYQNNHTGIRSGTIVDAETGNPIEGAVVNIAWLASAPMAGAEPSPDHLVAKYEVVTDKNGKYFVPNQNVERKSWFGKAYYKEQMIVFKVGYAAYRTYLDYDIMFGRTMKAFVNERQEYKEVKNKVKLYLWRDDWSHAKHVRWIDKRYIGELTKAELDKERELVEQER